MKPTVTVIGLGYVGFPLACAIAKSKKYQVYGLTRKIKTVLKIKNRKSPVEDELAKKDIKKVNLIPTHNGADCLPQSDFIVICVPTPVNPDHTPDLKPIIDTTRMISMYLKRGQTIILESTVNPGVCEDIIVPILEKTGLKAGRDFEVAHCPERINPGDPKWNVYNIPRNVGSLTSKGAQKTAAFYRSFLKAPIQVMKSLKEVESTKIFENAFRDINIAFVNELAMSFDRMGINTLNVIKGASSKPFAFMPHFPGAGVGGHCIAVDPYYLIHKAKEFGFEHKFLQTARQVNNQMPLYTVQLLVSAAKTLKIPLKQLKVGILGLAYKANISDSRESPAYEILKDLKRRKIYTTTYDPFIPHKSDVATLMSCLAKSNALIIATAHSQFIKELLPKILKKYKIKIIIDGRNCLAGDKIKTTGIYYKGIGV
jgi:UDP-N-acetyl-D-glucosamine dehydrogenase